MFPVQSVKNKQNKTAWQILACGKLQKVMECLHKPEDV